MFHPREGETGHRQDNDEEPNPSLPERRQNPGHDDEGEQNAAHQSADAEITQGADDEEIGQGEKQQARQTTLRRPEIPEMKFGSVDMPAGYFKK